MSEKNYRPETLALHSGHQPDIETGARAVPIFQTTSYMFRDTEHAANLFHLKEFGNIYTRLMNPTTQVFEQRMAALEHGVGALGVASGMSAITTAILTIAQAGDEIVSADNLYGGTYTLFRHTLKRFGITVRFVDSNDLAGFKKAINAKTKALYAETIGNPKLNVTNIKALSEIAHEHDIPLIIDNTATPYLCRPIDHGADIVVHSATKFIGGHGNSIGGVIIDSGKFNWTNGKFPLIAEPDPSYHDLDFVEALKPHGNIAYIIKCRLSILRPMGMAMSPFNAFLFLQGLETLHLRMPCHCANAKQVAEHLKGHDQVAWVNYPGLDDSPELNRAKTYLQHGFGALVGFGIKGGITAGQTFIDNLKLISHLANIGDAKSLAIHPASTTHSQLNPEEQQATGVTEDYIRLSIGIEHIDDIIDDINQALAKAIRA